MDFQTRSLACSTTVSGTSSLRIPDNSWSNCLSFMISLLVSPEFFAKLPPGAVHDHRYKHLGYAEHGGDLRVGKAFEKAQGEYFCRPWLQSAESPGQCSS